MNPYAIAAALLLLVSGATILYLRGDAAGAARVQAEFDQHLAADAKAELAAKEKADEVEKTLAAASEMAGASYERGKRDAETEQALVVAGLRAGTTRLQHQWAGCETQRLSDATASSVLADAVTRNREESAGRIVRAAADCDAQVAGLQSLIGSYLRSLGAQ